MSLKCLELACDILNAGRGRVRFAGTTPEDLKEAQECLSREKTRELIKRKLIVKIQAKGISRSRANKNLEQRRKGKQKGPGTRSGTTKSYERRSKIYVSRIRAIRDELKLCRTEGIVSKEEYRYHYRRLRSSGYSTRQKVRMRVSDGSSKK